ncbi:MAG: tRNA pseudouridine(13) synthase TruD [Saccharolobus sp.]|uniref:tRNA pseudouridine(13) synthase TruD n=1 Tax=Saccharolobus sp. TaxID=2100761 RepID=UPI0028CDD138|nr:tRNA pseudouridine(13) synthase TruD [Saccharolobus sp.]MDT7861478.1 tRNA pseudouridine(13) synthase TruD [Saccharolobus sp.]
MKPHEIDIAIGMERYYYEDWNEINATIERPNGFKVIEEIDFRSAEEWRGDRVGKYMVYLLTKKGIDHFSMLAEIQKVLRKKVNYLGIKDANAITEQLVYIIKEGDENSIIQEYNTENISLRFLGFSPKKLNHTGNIFEITLITSDFDIIKERLRDISKDPYIPAYIGYQRFGSRRPITHIVGKYLLKRDWERAFYYILTYPFLSESDEIRSVRKLIANNEFKETLRLLPSKFKQEKTLIKNYLKFGNYYLALKNSFIPISLYLDAYQSYIFNLYLSRKLDEYRKLAEKDNVNVIIPTYYDNCDELCKQIYLEEGIERNFFNIKEFKVSLRTLIRKAFMKVRNIKINEKTNTISFTLDRGMYATVVLREILKGDPRKFT